jgi:hypothetical protein
VRSVVALCAVLLAPDGARGQPAPADAAPVVDSGIRIGAIPGAIRSLRHGQGVTGYGGDLWAGYELVHGNLGVTPFASVGFDNFTGSGGGQLLLAMPSVKVGYHFGSWIPAGMFGVGFARTWEGTGGGRSATQSYLALSIGAELVHQIVSVFAIGIAVHYTPLVDPSVNSFIDFGVSATVTL